MRIALDTNILAYAEGIGSAGRRDATMEMLERLPQENILLPAQVLGELYRVLTGKAKRKPSEARSTVLQWADSFPIVDSTWTSFQFAFDLAVDHGIGIWDALILSAAAENRCRIVLSEDLQHGFTLRGLTVVNPYKAPMHPLFASLL